MIHQTFLTASTNPRSTLGGYGRDSLCYLNCLLTVVSLLRIIFWMPEHAQMKPLLLRRTSIMAARNNCLWWNIHESVHRLGCFGRHCSSLLARATLLSYLLGLKKIFLQTIFILEVRLSNSAQPILVCTWKPQSHLKFLEGVDIDGKRKFAAIHLLVTVPTL